MVEHIDRRVLGAIRLIDRATNNILIRKFIIKSANAVLQRNRSNLYVITNATGLTHHTNMFPTPPTTPALNSVVVELEIVDPLNQYLPRKVSISLPRDAAPENSKSPDSLFQPINISLYASPNAKILNNWSSVRVSITQNDPENGLQPVRGCLLRIVKSSNDDVLSSGISDERGEALIIIPGVPITQFADEEEEEGSEESPVTISELPIRLEASHGNSAEWPVNPDVLETGHAAELLQTQTFSLRTGRMESRSLELTS